MALPQRPMIIMDAPNFVNRPNPSKASGQIPAHTNELANPNSTTNHIEMSVVWPRKLIVPFVKIMSNVNVPPSNVHIRNMFTWLMNFGISEMPIRYPQMVTNNV